jgi:hypothetical protein
MDIDDLNREIGAIMMLQNNRPIDEFEGRSPSEMHYLLNKTFDKDSPMQFRAQVSKEVLSQIPFLKLTEFYLRQIEEQGPLKLTAKGNMPVKLVKMLYGQKFIVEKYIELGFCKLNKEEDSLSVQTTRIISEVARLTKKKNNKISLTNKAKKFLDKDDKYGLFKELFIAFTTRFNWAYFDKYGEHPTGNLGFAFTLELLSKYGDKEREDTFYGKKYLLAFPSLLEFARFTSYITPEKDMINCFSIRTFDRFAELFGFITIEEKGPDRVRQKKYIKKTAILDQLIVFD